MSLIASSTPDILALSASQVPKLGLADIFAPQPAKSTHNKKVLTNMYSFLLILLHSSFVFKPIQHIPIILL